eukprot:6185210-Pleurochrysis_carterae.AAC.4
MNAQFTGRMRALRRRWPAAQRSGMHAAHRVRTAAAPATCSTGAHPGEEGHASTSTRARPRARALQSK